MSARRRLVVMVVAFEMACAGLVIGVAAAAGDGGGAKNVGSLTVVVGATGEKGASGSIGPAGAAGEKGTNGPTGTGLPALVEMVLAAVLGGGGVLGGLGAGWKWWLKKKLEERSAERMERVDAARKVNALLPTVHAEVNAARAEQKADFEIRREPMMRMDVDGNCVWVNKAWRRLTGYGLEESTGTQWLRRVQAQDRDRVKRGWAAALEEGKNYEQRFQLVDQNGEVTPVECHGAPTKTIDGETLGWLIKASRITEEEWQEALAEIDWRNATPEPSTGVRDTLRTNPRQTRPGQQ